jgi:hypothetical protein
MQPLPRQAILIVNAMSRTGAGAFDEVHDKLVGAGIELIAAHAVDDPDQMEPMIRDAISKAPMVIVGSSSLESAFDPKQTLAQSKIRASRLHREGPLESDRSRCGRYPEISIDFTAARPRVGLKCATRA